MTDKVAELDFDLRFGGELIRAIDFTLNGVNYTELRLTKGEAFKLHLTQKDGAYPIANDPTNYPSHDAALEMAKVFAAMHPRHNFVPRKECQGDPSCYVCGRERDGHPNTEEVQA